MLLDAGAEAAADFPLARAAFDFDAAAFGAGFAATVFRVAEGLGAAPFAVRALAAGFVVFAFVAFAFAAVPFVRALIVFAMASPVG